MDFTDPAVILRDQAEGTTASDNYIAAQSSVPGEFNIAWGCDDVGIS